MELRELKVEIPSNEGRHPARSFGIDEQIAHQSAGSKYRNVGAISRAIQIVQTARVTSSVIPHHRHSPRMATDVEWGDEAASDNDRKESSAVII
jgi:hypothetical protein